MGAEFCSRAMAAVVGQPAAVMLFVALGASIAGATFTEELEWPRVDGGVGAGVGAGVGVGVSGSSSRSCTSAFSAKSEWSTAFSANSSLNTDEAIDERPDRAAVTPMRDSHSISARERFNSDSVMYEHYVTLCGEKWLPVHTNARLENECRYGIMQHLLVI